MSDQSVDEAALIDLLDTHGVDWVLSELEVSEILAYLHEWHPLLQPDLGDVLETLRDEGYPAEIIALLEDNQHQPWLTPPVGASRERGQ